MSDETTALVLPKTYVVAATERRDAVLADAALIGKINDEHDLKVAVQALAGLQTYARECEATRAEVKAPVIAFGKAIEKAFSDHIFEVETSVRRVQGKVSEYQQAQRLRMERERQQREQEERKLREEEAAKLAQATTPKEVAAVQERFAEKVSALPTVQAAPTVKGLTTQDWWFFETTDKQAFQKAHPGCCKIDLLEGEIRGMLANQERMLSDNPKMKRALAGERVDDLIPGLRIWKGVKASTRGQRAIDV